MARCILHVGMHKTGSSSIQATLARVDLPDVAILKTPGANQSGPIRTAFDRVNRVAKSRSRGGVKAAVAAGILNRRDKVRKSLADFLTANADRDAIISAEGFDNLDRDAFEEFLGLVPHKEITVIAYVRSPHGHMESALQQRIKAGVTTLRPASFVPKYRRHLEKYGVSKVEFCPVLFDRSTLHNGCVVQDFFARIGHAITPEQVVLANEGASRDAISLILLANLWRAERGLRPVSAARLTAWLSTLEGPKLTIHPDTFQAASEPSRDSITWVENLLNHRFEPREPRPDDMRDLSELLTPSEAALAWLKSKVGEFDDPAEAMSAAIEEQILLRKSAGRREAA